MTRTTAQRWRLLLGRYSESALGACLGGADGRRDGALDFLYAREYRLRGIRTGDRNDRNDKREGSDDPTRLAALDWLAEVRDLFPETVAERLTDEAVTRYGLGDLLKDPRVVEDLTPTPGLLRSLLALEGRADPALKAQIRAVADGVIAQIMARLRTALQRAMSGRRNRHARSPHKAAANFDARATIRANLQHWDSARATILAEQLRFSARQRRHLDWTVILCVDQSGSMTDSLIFSAIMAA
ncbi:MAG: VWA domain-containing protein, partial [Paracoccus sp. (in: a-proteobacteria)]|nr:VWA domain-containing protein [Paracoccus sp. (in: a-proteobacteria)]